MISIGRLFFKSFEPKPDKSEKTDEDVFMGVLSDDDSDDDLFSEHHLQAPLVGVNTHVEVIDYCAQVIQTLRFRNNEKSVLEATFEFKLPQFSAVSSFAADIGDRHLIGKIQEKQKAEDTYDDALAAGHTATLLETKDSKLFTVQLGNVKPGTEAFVTLTYERLATLENEKIVLTLDGSDADDIIFGEPPAETPEYDARVKPGFNFDVHISTQSRLRSVSSSSHPIAVEIGEAGATVRLAESANWRERKDFVVEAQVDDPHQPSVRIQRVKDTQIAMVSFYPKIETPQTKCEMIFVLDRSGSMSGRPIEYAKKTLQFFLRSLPEDAFFNIFSFGSRFECFRDSSVPFNEDTLDKATIYVSGLEANLGGTNIFDPLDSIFKKPTKPGYPRQVFILTDGEVLDKHRCIQLVKNNVNSTRLFGFGIGNGVDKDLMNRMAKAGEGYATFIDDPSDIRKNVMRQLEQALQPGLTDVEIKWKNAVSGETINICQTPKKPPPIFRGTRLVTFALLPDKCPACKVALCGSFGDSIYMSEMDVNPVSLENTPGEQIMKLGIRSLIEDIYNGNGGIDDDEEKKKSIIDLSIKYEVLSKYTAFVAIGNGDEALKTHLVTQCVRRRSRIHKVLMRGCAAYPCSSMCCMSMSCQKRFGAAPRSCMTGFRLMGIRSPKDGISLTTGEREPKKACRIELDKSLDNVILQQKASGCFNALALDLLDIPESIRDAIPKDLPDGMKAELAKDIWVTLLVLIGLEKKYGDKKSEWGLLAKKSEKWASHELGVELFAAWRTAAEVAF